MIYIFHTLELETVLKTITYTYAPTYSYSYDKFFHLKFEAIIFGKTNFINATEFLKTLFLFYENIKYRGHLCMN